MKGKAKRSKGIIEVDLASVSINFLDAIPELISRAIWKLEEQFIKKEDMLIFIPEHINRLITTSAPFNPPRVIKVDRLMDVQVIDGYENSIVVASRNGVLYGIKPIKIKIPS